MTAEVDRLGALSRQETAARAETETAGGRPSDRWVAGGVAGAVVLALVGLHLVLSRSIDGFLLADGTGYLANARWLVGEAGSTWQGPAAFYHAGWSLVMAPVYLFTRSPDAVHTAVLVVNAVLASLAFVAYAAVAEIVFGLRRWLALLAGLVAATYPAVLLQASFEWSESLFHLLFPLFVLAAAWLVRTGSPAAGVALGLAAAALNATHPKGLGAVVAVGLGFAVLGATERLPRRAAVAGLVALVLGFVATRALHGALQDALYDESAAAIEGGVLARLSDPVEVWGAFRAFWGQVWYATVATLGLAPLGALTLARHRDRRLAGLVLGTCLVMLAASCLQMSDGTRVDHMVYGRYNEGFLPVLLVAGVAGVVAHRHRLHHLAARAALLAAATGFVAVALRGGSAFTGDVMPLNVTGVLVYRTDVGAIDVRTVTVLAIAALVVLAALTRWRLAVGGALLVAFFVGSSLSVEARTIRPWADYWASVTEIPAVVDRLDADGPIAYDLGSYHVDAADLYQLELTHRGGLLFFDSRHGHRPATDLAIASPHWEQPGARLVYAEAGIFRQALWVMPGALQDDLAARGLLVPEQYSAPLPPAARRAALEVRDHGGDLVVRVRNEGATWLPVGPVPGVVDGTVRLGVRLYAGDDEVGSITRELPRVLLPGDEVTVRVPVRDLGISVPVRAVVSLRQESVAWWDESAVTLDLALDDP